MNMVKSRRNIKIKKTVKGHLAVGK